MNKLNVNID